MYHPLLLPELHTMLQENDRQGLQEFCDALHPAVTAEVLEALETEEIWQVLEKCPFERRVEIFGFINLAKQAELVEFLDRKELSDLIEEMPPDDRVALLSRMEPEKVEDLLPLIAQADRRDIRRLLSYPEGSAGSIMTTEYASLPADITVREALEQLRRQAPDRETIYYIYICDEGRRLIGFVSLQTLILAKPHKLLSEIMERDVISVRVDDDQEFVAQELAKYDFLAIPVVDNQNRLVGIVTHDDVLDILQEAATEDAQRLGAIEPLRDSYLETPLTAVVWKRGIWLVVLLFAALITAALLDQFKEISAQYTWMVSFIPLVLASGGNAGSQSATLVIRTLATEDPRRNTEILRHELPVGLLLGLSLGLIGFLFASIIAAVPHALVVGTTVAMVVSLATIYGTLLPMLFKSLGMDPALMSNPLTAALADVLGILIYYAIALAFLQTVP